MAVRLQKWLADQAVAPSRRKAEQWIVDKRVQINGQIATLGQSVAPGDKVMVDNQLVQEKLAVKTEVLLYHKPIGEICSRASAEAIDTVFEGLPEPTQGRWILVGRLDVQTSGLLLLTQCGDLAQKLMHPSFELTRTYKLRIHGALEEDVQQQLCQGVQLDDGMAKFDTLQSCQSSRGSNQWWQVTLHQGRNRIVRRMFEKVQVPVNRLMRIGYGPLALPRDLYPGQWQFLTDREIDQLYNSVGAA